MTARKVLFVQATSAAAYPPLLHAGAIFAESGWRVTFLSAPRLGLELDYPPDADFEVVNAPARPTHAWSKADYARYCWQAVRIARRVQPDLIYASDPIGALPGLLAARAAGAGLIYHEHDSPDSAADLHPVVRFARRGAARAAQCVVFPSAGRAQRCAPDLGCSAGRMAVVWNTPGRAEITVPSGSPSNWFILYYQGGLSPDRVPVAAVEALSKYQGRAALRLVGFEAPGAVGYLQYLIGRFGSAERGGIIDHVGTVTRGEMLQMATSADAGLMLVPSGSTSINFAHMAGASNKAFEYMAAGLPLIVSDEPEWREMFVAPGHALAVNPDDADSIAQVIGRLIDNPQLRAKIGRRNQDRIRGGWNYETCFAPVLQAAEAALASERGRF